jgi:hypothetical protein
VAERGRHIIILRVHRYLGMERKAEVGSLLLGKHPERKRKECGEVDLSMSSYIAGGMLRAILCELAELFVTTFSLITILGSNDRQRELARKRLLFLYSTSLHLQV